MYSAWVGNVVHLCQSMNGYQPSMNTALHAPNPVRIFHRRAGCLHIFTSPDLRGLHVGHSDLEQAFALIPEAVSGLVELESGIDAIYEPEAPFEQFKLKVLNDGELFHCFRPART
jgi:hypothetical protein